MSGALVTAETPSSQTSIRTPNGCTYEPVGDSYLSCLEAQAAAGDTVAGGYAADLCAVMPGTIRVWATRGKLTAVTYEAYDDIGCQREAQYLLADVLPLAKKRGGPFAAFIEGAPDVPLLLTVPEAATRYTVSEVVISDWITSGELASSWTGLHPHERQLVDSAEVAAKVSSLNASKASTGKPRGLSDLVRAELAASYEPSKQLQQEWADTGRVPLAVVNDMERLAERASRIADGKTARRHSQDRPPPLWPQGHSISE